MAGKKLKEDVNKLIHRDGETQWACVCVLQYFEWAGESGFPSVVDVVPTLATSGLCSSFSK